MTMACPNSLRHRSGFAKLTQQADMIANEAIERDDGFEQIRNEGCTDNIEEADGHPSFQKRLPAQRARSIVTSMFEDLMVLLNADNEAETRIEENSIRQALDEAANSPMIRIDKPSNIGHNKKMPAPLIEHLQSGLSDMGYKMREMARTLGKALSTGWITACSGLRKSAGFTALRHMFTNLLVRPHYALSRDVDQLQVQILGLEEKFDAILLLLKDHYLQGSPHGTSLSLNSLASIGSPSGGEVEQLTKYQSESTQAPTSWMLEDEFHEAKDNLNHKVVTTHADDRR